MSYAEGKDFSSAASREIAAEKGYRVVTPSYTELFLDIDSEEGVEKFNKWNHVLPPHSTSIVPSKTRGHYHYTVTVPTADWTAEAKLLLMAILGGDLQHVAMSYKRLLRGDVDPVLFFEPYQWIAPPPLPTPFSNRWQDATEYVPF